jgi:hypothetical protein
MFYAGIGMGISIALMGFKGDLDRRALQASHAPNALSQFPHVT